MLDEFGDFDPSVEQVWLDQCLEMANRLSGALSRFE